MKTQDQNQNENAFKHWMSPQLLQRLGSSLEKIAPSFQTKKFLSYKSRLEPLELKPRVQLIRDALKESLPADYATALQIILKSIHHGNVSGFDAWPYAEFIQAYGLNYPKISLQALSEVTKVFTAEWAVRPFIQKHHKETMSFLLLCAGDENQHLRRWASEGSRPRLPWGIRLQEFVVDPSPTLPILEKLKFDPELYVRKSVANHLNDITKDHPKIVIDLLKKWQRQATKVEDKKHLDWIIYRSLRTLIKDGHPGALSLIGVKKAKIQIEKIKIRKPKIKLGERLDFGFTLRSTSKEDQKIVVDYIIHFVKSNQRQAAKVFKLKTFKLSAGKTIQIEKSHLIKKITTRQYYSGLHALEIQVNGCSHGKANWHLKL